MATKSAADQIAEYKEKIAALEQEALNELKGQRKALAKQLADLDEQIAALEGGKPSRASTGTRKKITIEDVVGAIKAKATNYPAIAKALGCSTANVAAKIKAEGKKAGIVKTGERASMVLSVK